MKPEKIPHRVWAEIDLDNLVHNFEVARAAAPQSRVVCVIKADAYGHGAVRCAKALAAAGAREFAVATPEEALQLRRNGITEEGVLLLGAALPEDVTELAKHNVAVTVSGIETAKAYAVALNGACLLVHVKVDTGMSRLGVKPGMADEVLAIAALDGLRVCGLYTHFAVADEPQEDAFTKGQAAAFEALAAEMHQKGLQVPLLHLANSAGILHHSYAHAGAIRPGIMLYGSNPMSLKNPAPLKPVMALRTRVLQVHEVPAGQTVSYGRTWQADRPARIATLGIGYADGLFRPLSGRIEMLVRGKRAPQVGRICMDMTMLDVTDVPGVAEGDVVTVFGEDGDERILADEVAAAAGTISYEVFCAIAPRVARLYYQGGKPVDEVCYIEKL